MVDKLNAKKVVLLDFQEPYSVGLADAAEAVLKRKGVETIRQSTSVNTTDFSSLVTRVPNDADVVFFPTQQPADAQTFGQQLLEQGKRAKVFGGDGANNPAQFKLNGSYVSNFAPDISGIAVVEGARSTGGRRRIRARRSARSGRRRTSRPQVAMNAIKQACDAGNGTIAEPRATSLRQVKRSGPRTRSSGARSASPQGQRPAEREVLHLPDPVERHVQARRLARRTHRSERPGHMPGRSLLRP